MELKLIKVAYIGANIQPFDSIWGGTMATNHAFLKCFENDDEYEISPLFKKNFIKGFELEQIKNHIKDADIVHVDTGRALDEMYKAGMKPPDVIGVIARSPIKKYNTGEPLIYPAEWYYQAKIIRLNWNTEVGHPELVTGLMKHGVDTDRLKPCNNKKKYVLWAGNAENRVKDYAKFEAIKFDLPEGYEWKTLSKYNVEDYWELLKETAILINTSLFETFCCCAFEAMACGVPVIWKKELQGKGIHENAGVRVEDTVKDYRFKIVDLLNNERYVDEGLKCRKYVEENCTFEIMKESIKNVYKAKK